LTRLPRINGKDVVKALKRINRFTLALLPIVLLKKEEKQKPIRRNKATRVA